MKTNIVLISTPNLGVGKTPGHEKIKYIFLVKDINKAISDLRRSGFVYIKVYKDKDKHVIEIKSSRTLVGANMSLLCEISKSFEGRNVLIRVKTSDEKVFKLKQCYLVSKN